MLKLKDLPFLGKELGEECEASARSDQVAHGSSVNVSNESLGENSTSHDHN